MFEIHPENTPKQIILHVSGSVLLPVAVEFYDQIIPIVANKKNKEIVFDLSQIEKFDATALGVLVSLSNRYVRHGRKICIFCPPSHIEKLIMDMGIEKFFPVFENEEELNNYSLSRMG
ncbi:MAG: STAS domain-containing protein [Desulfovibrio sp.]|nr:STAS domain-containing protein [Desulfovibrio sp.]